MKDPLQQIPLPYPNVIRNYYYSTCHKWQSVKLLVCTVLRTNVRTYYFSGVLNIFGCLVCFMQPTLSVMFSLLETENEENGLVCLRIIIELHKQFRPPVSPEVCVGCVHTYILYVRECDVFVCVGVWVGLVSLHAYMYNILVFVSNLCCSVCACKGAHTYRYIRTYVGT